MHMGAAGTWYDLPLDLLGNIVSHLHFFDDFMALAFACKAWHQFVTSLAKEKPSLPPSFPSLMLAEDKNDEEDGRRRFYSLFDGKVYQLKLPEACSKVCVGASYGWLLTIDLKLDINLLHPFSRRKIGLPPLPTSVNNYIPDSLFEVSVRKVVMSTNPWKPSSSASAINSCDSCIVFVIYGHSWKLGFTRIDYNYGCQAGWTTVPTPRGMYDDIICYNGEFYAVDGRSLLYMCEFNGYDQNAKATILPVEPPKGTADTTQKYLVKSSGDLLMVLRHRAGPFYSAIHQALTGEIDYVTTGFTVLRLNKHTIGRSDHEGEKKISYDWEKVDSLGDRALFLGANSSVSLGSSDYNKGCLESNSIYFTDDCEFNVGPGVERAGYDMGVFSMEDGTIKPHYTGRSISKYCPPLWYI